jgi:H+/gluconate symporter-like permease
MFFKTTSWAALLLGIAGSVFVVTVGLIFLEWRRRTAMRAGEGYGTSHINEPEKIDTQWLPHPLLALFPLFVVG